MSFGLEKQFYDQHGDVVVHQLLDDDEGAFAHYMDSARQQHQEFGLKVETLTVGSPR